MTTSFVVDSGCLARDGGSTYEVADGRLRITFTTDYDDDCGTEELQAQDRAVWQVLEDGSIEIDGQRLTLTAEELGLGCHAEVATD